MGDSAWHDVLWWVQPADLADGRNDPSQVADANTQVVCGGLAAVHAEKPASVLRPLSASSN